MVVSTLLLSVCSCLLKRAISSFCRRDSQSWLCKSSLARIKRRCLLFKSPYFALKTLSKACLSCSRWILWSCRLSSLRLVCLTILNSSSLASFSNRSLSFLLCSLRICFWRDSVSASCSKCVWELTSVGLGSIWSDSLSLPELRTFV